jgi:hypothetical protein
MKNDKTKAKKLENEASTLIDEGAQDEAKLDKAAEIMAEAEKLKGPVNANQGQGEDGDGEKEQGN